MLPTGKVTRIDSKTIVQQIIKDIGSYNSSDSLNANKFSKSPSIFDSKHTISNTWGIVPKNIKLLQKVWTTEKEYSTSLWCGLNIADEADSLTEEIIINKEEGMEETFLRYVLIDDNLQTSGEKSASEISTDIINSKVMSNQEVEESVSEDEEIIVPNLPSSIVVRKALDVLRCTLEQRGANMKVKKTFIKFQTMVNF
ncbi:hypothetical protein AVEN_273843-1 [Araneus ventricosus]|uniref:DDE-1 domain-containing protein n=1 Tax=Araneus ventricosus TaxID=182803 RepID=A0A4Y2L0B9_ARAVE|nr:hypothetical protein AVEN_273843-1 [Araneus ventricosus]